MKTFLKFAGVPFFYLAAFGVGFYLSAKVFFVWVFWLSLALGVFAVAGCVPDPGEPAFRLENGVGVYLEYAEGKDDFGDNVFDEELYNFAFDVIIEQTVANTAISRKEIAKELEKGYMNLVVTNEDLKLAGKDVLAFYISEGDIHMENFKVGELSFLAHEMGHYLQWIFYNDGDVDHENQDFFWAEDSVEKVAGTAIRVNCWEAANEP